jgi:hypothetical protein
MEANGWTKETVKPGDVITGIGYQYSDGHQIIRLERVVFADGKELRLYASQGNSRASQPTVVWAGADRIQPPRADVSCTPRVLWCQSQGWRDHRPLVPYYSISRCYFAFNPQRWPCTSKRHVS